MPARYFDYMNNRKHKFVYSLIKNKSVLISWIYDLPTTKNTEKIRLSFKIVGKYARN